MYKVDSVSPLPQKVILTFGTTYDPSYSGAIKVRPEPHGKKATSTALRTEEMAIGL
jgi:hypothetical protein